MTLTSPHDLVASLQSTTCPACGGNKVSRGSLCRRCYHALPKDLPLRLYKPLGGGYAEAVAAALTRLGRHAFITPPGAGRHHAAKPAAHAGGEQLRLFPRGHSEAFKR